MDKDLPLKIFKSEINKIGKPTNNNKNTIIIDCSFENIEFDKNFANLIKNYSKDYKIVCHVDKITSSEIFSYLNEQNINYELIDTSTVSSEGKFFEIFSNAASIICTSEMYKIIAIALDIPFVIVQSDNGVK